LEVLELLDLAALFETEALHSGAGEGGAEVEDAKGELNGIHE
jgi:hypothetical protein